MNRVEKIAEGIEYAKKELGFRLVSEDWGNKQYKCACALGCLLVKNNVPLDEESNETEAQKLLEVNQGWISAFIAGFDDTPWDLGVTLTTVEKETMSKEEIKELEEAYHSGVELRQRFSPMKYDQFFDAFVDGQE